MEPQFAGEIIRELVDGPVIEQDSGERRRSTTFSSAPETWTAARESRPYASNGLAVSTSDSAHLTLRANSVTNHARNVSCVSGPSMVGVLVRLNMVQPSVTDFT